MRTRRVSRPVFRQDRHPDHHYTHAPAPGLRAAREARGWTVEELAGATGYPADFIRSLEADPTKPVERIHTSRISAVLGTATDAVRGGQGGQITRTSDIEGSG